jgi:hypothetical protein
VSTRSAWRIACGRFAPCGAGPVRLRGPLRGGAKPRGAKSNAGNGELAIAFVAPAASGSLLDAEPGMNSSESDLALIKPTAISAASVRKAVNDVQLSPKSGNDQSGRGTGRPDPRPVARTLCKFTHLYPFCSNYRHRIGKARLLVRSCSKTVWGDDGWVRNRYR